MDFEEYKTKINELQQKYNRDIHKLKKEYAITNNTVKTGDVIQDNIGKIIVKSIGVYYADKPECFYCGTELKKNGEPRIKKSTRTVYQSNIGR